MMKPRQRVMTKKRRCKGDEGVDERAVRGGRVRAVCGVASLQMLAER